METRICAVYDEHEGRYGYRRIMAALCNSMDEPVNHKCVQRLMQKMGLPALIRAKNRSRYVTGQTDVHVPNVLRRDFCATASNQKWANDVTEFNVNGQKLYLPACMRKLPQIENNMKIEASISLRRRDEEVKVHGEPDCWNLG